MGILGNVVFFALNRYWVSEKSTEGYYGWCWEYVGTNEKHCLLNLSWKWTYCLWAKQWKLGSICSTNTRIHTKLTNEICLMSPIVLDFKFNGGHSCLAIFFLFPFFFWVGEARHKQNGEYEGANNSSQPKDESLWKPVQSSATSFVSQSA